jgi:hypothetical protein
LNFVDVCAAPGAGKSTLAYKYWGDKSITWDGLPLPTEWQPFLKEIVKLFELVSDHPTYSAVLRMNDRTAKKMATVYRMQDNRVFMQTAWMQRILGFGWRFHQMGRDINMIRPALELMPTSVGVAFLEADLETLLQRNRDREKVPETAHENRSFQVPHMLACMPLAKQVMRERGVPIIEIDVQHQSIDDARAELVAFSQTDKLPSRQLVTERRYDIAVKYRFFRHLIEGNDPKSEELYRWHIEARKAANAKINLGMDSKSGADQYVADCRNLLISMANKGFDPAYAIPIDPDGELLGGAHRLACALALGIDAVPVTRHEQKAWAPAWSADWFVENDINLGDIDRIREDWRHMKAQGIAAWPV